MEPGDSQRGGIDVIVTDEAGRAVRVPGLARWLSAIAPARARGTVAVALVSDSRIRDLNQRYRGRNVATDVLSFVYGSPSPSAIRSGGPQPHLGDIVIARGVAARQASAAGHRLTAELRILALHGLLHLLGYDHERDSGQMARLERKLRRRGGLTTGLIERRAPAGDSGPRQRARRRRTARAARRDAGVSGARRP
jgi:probable rRNA maturation factor